MKSNLPRRAPHNSFAAPTRLVKADMNSLKGSTGPFLNALKRFFVSGILAIQNLFGCAIYIIIAVLAPGPSFAVVLREILHAQATKAFCCGLSIAPGAVRLSWLWSCWNIRKLIEVEASIHISNHHSGKPCTCARWPHWVALDAALPTGTALGQRY